MRRIRLIGLTSSDSQNCVKAYTSGESCSFSVEKTVTKAVSARIYLYPKNSSRVIHTIRFDVASSSTRDDLSSGIEFINNGQVVSSLDLGEITLSSIAGTRIHVRNSGSQKTSAIESMASTFTGSAAFTLARDTCANKELNPGERCYFDIRLLPDNGIDGINNGTYTVRAQGQSSGSDLSLVVDLTVPVQPGSSVIISESSGSTAIFSLSATRWESQEFTASQSGTLESVAFKFGHPIAALPTGTTTYKLYDATELSPGVYEPNTLIATSESLDLATTNNTPTFYPLNFPSAPQIIAGSTYFIVADGLDLISGDLFLSGGTPQTSPVGHRVWTPNGGSSWNQEPTNDIEHIVSILASNTGGSESSSTVAPAKLIL